MILMFVIALLGCVGGLILGLAGTYLAVQSAQGPRERAFMVWAAVRCWVVVAAYPATVWLAPERWPLVWCVQAVLLGVVVQRWSRRQREVRRQEQHTIDALRRQTVESRRTTVE